MAYLDTPSLPEPKAFPNYLVGAASPLWAYFGAAAAGGVAFWWMTRWAQPVNLEALFDGAVPVAEPLNAAAEALAEVPPAAVEAAAEIAVATAPALPPVADAAPDLATPSDAEPTAVVEAAPEPVAPAAEAPSVDAAPPTKPRARKSAPLEGFDEA